MEKLGTLVDFLIVVELAAPVPAQGTGGGLGGVGTVINGFVVWFQGFVLGVAIAAPVGPIGLLCIRRTLEHNQMLGFATGMGAAVADTIFGAIAAFGFSAALVFLTGHEATFRLIGGLFLLAVAVRTFTAKPPTGEDESPPPKTCFGGFITGLTLTLTNPVTILAFVGLFAGIGVTGTLAFAQAAVLVLGVFIGSAAWWLTLSSGVALVRHRISEERLTLINHITAVALALFGIWAVVTAFTSGSSFGLTLSPV
jgi:threonine/homoserine/homoserine lactone efflux protein